MPHMWDNGWWFGGMHFLWWIVWVILIVLLFSLVMPRQRRMMRRETPLEVLQRRYAAGEISTEEYEERKTRLERDKSKAE